MTEPAPPRKSDASTVLIIVLAVLAVPCVLGVLAAIAIPSFLRFQRRAKAAEARAQVRALCRAELAYHAEHREWLAAGPLPNPIPGVKAVPFPRDESFERLGFAPGRVRYQYEVAVDGDPSGPSAAVHCLARGDLDGDGKTSRFEVRIGEDGELGPVEVDRETE